MKSKYQIRICNYENKRSGEANVDKDNVIKLHNATPKTRKNVSQIMNFERDGKPLTREATSLKKAKITPVIGKCLEMHNEQLKKIIASLYRRHK